MGWPLPGSRRSRKQLLSHRWAVQAYSSQFRRTPRGRQPAVIDESARQPGVSSGPSAGIWLRPDDSCRLNDSGESLVAFVIPPVPAPSRASCSISIATTTWSAIARQPSCSASPISPQPRRSLSTLTKAGYVIDLTDDPRRLAHRLLTAHRCGCRPGQRRMEAYTAPSVRRGFRPSLPMRFPMSGRWEA